MNDALFLALSQAKAQPDRWARALGAGTQAGSDILGGYLQGKEYKTKQQEASLKPFEIWSKISDSAGPDVANSIFKQRGIPIPDMTGAGAGVQRTPEELARMGGGWATKQLGNQNVLGEMHKRNLDIENNKPFASDVADAIGKGDTATLTKIHAARGEPVPFREMNAAISAKRPAMMAPYFAAKVGDIQLHQLPSEMPPTTLPGAAAQVLIGSRMGMSLIAKPGSPQRTAAARADAARSIIRNSPTDEALKTMDYTGNLAQRWAVFKQNLTADPGTVDNPNVRKDMYDLFKDMRASAIPFINNHLANRETYLGPTPVDVRQRELGLNIPDIPFDAGPGSVPNPNVPTGVPQGKVKVSKGTESYFIDPQQLPDAAKDGFMPQ